MKVIKGPMSRELFDKSTSVRFMQLPTREKKKKGRAQSGPEIKKKKRTRPSFSSRILTPHPASDRATTSEVEVKYSGTVFARMGHGAPTAFASSVPSEKKKKKKKPQGPVRSMLRMEEVMAKVSDLKRLFFHPGTPGTQGMAAQGRESQNSTKPKRS